MAFTLEGIVEFMQPASLFSHRGMSPYQVTLELVLVNAGEPARLFVLDPRCARIVDGRLFMDHDRRSPDGVTCRCTEKVSDE